MLGPPLIARSLVVAVFAIRSERQLCSEVEVNLAYRWFCQLGTFPIIRCSAVLGTSAFGRAMPFVGYLRAWWQSAWRPVWLAAKPFPSMRA